MTKKKSKKLSAYDNKNFILMILALDINKDLDTLTLENYLFEEHPINLAADVKQIFDWDTEEDLINGLSEIVLNKYGINLKDLI